MTDRKTSWQISSASSRVKSERKLENEAPRRRVMQVEQFVPRLRVAAPATRQQFTFRLPCGFDFISERKRLNRRKEP